MGFAFVNNSKINGIHSINSQNTHITMFVCNNVTLSRLTITAPGHSPNTDGIKMARSQGININNVHIGTGDDCIAILSGTKNLNISNVYCGPGHGISVGSFGHNSDEFDIEEIFVKNCTFKDTTNGLRIKTWASPLNHPLKAYNIVYEDITMIDVHNPINIDQEYCPFRNCGNKVTPSGVQISDISYRNIRGTCRGDVAVNFRCSASNPCQNISLENIDLRRSSGSKERLRNRCSHVNGAIHGQQFPPSCI
ncbi:putative polygalacturonase [Lupinus albus]|uniref:Putative polygalacturonase n=1 Tax=Lupinus albus TaxID=3870 RepID=A0A6A4NP48_LUPAL|nr:putative polygalacturonase [Lupinus albus]